MKSELRKDYIQDKYVIIAPQRGKRTGDLEVRERIKRYANPEESIFHPKNLKSTKAILTVGSEPNWRIKVIPNKFPAVSLGNSKAYGAQEVIVETPDPNLELEDLPVSQIAELLRVYAKRTKVIQAIKNIQYIIIFKNDGGWAGASIRHSHSQIFAANFIPPHLLDKSHQVLRYRLQTGRDIYQDVIAKESKSPRQVWQDKHIACFTPYASMHNYECWIMPKRKIDNITQMNGRETRSFAKILKHILTKVSVLGLSYNFYFHQVIYDENQHLYMKITPRAGFWAGVEIGSGIIITTTSPEEAAHYYREGAGKI